jgi:ankyrin repeat protein
LEQLKKQAKELLERYRAEGEATFALHDAQRLLAREYGFPSWSKLKAYVDGVNVEQLAEAVKAGDQAAVRKMLKARPELVGRDMGASNEHRALHYAVLGRDAAMVRLLMEAGADARKGIWPHRDATSAMAIARDREYAEIVALIEDMERRRQQEMSCPIPTAPAAQDRVHAAIRGGETEAAIRLLEKDGALIHGCDSEGASPLHVAAEAGDEPLVEWLLARQANAGKWDMRERTPLDRAALAAEPRNDGAKAFPAIARLLLEHGAPLTIHGAVALGDALRVRELVEAEPGVLRQIEQRGGLLSLAVNHGQLETVRLLLDLGADVNEHMTLEELEEPTESWGMPLWWAALANRRDLAELLLDRGADPNANVYASGWPLRNAWGHADGAVKRLLLERGAKQQPYMVAEAHDVAEAKRLLEADAGEELAHELAWSACDHGCPEIVALALPRLNYPLNDAKWHWILIQPIRGATADHADREGHFACMEALLRHGIDPNVARYGQTALHFAAAYRGGVSEEDRARFAAMLIDSGARLDMRDELLRSTPLGWACRWGRRAMVEALIARGAAIDEPDAEPWATPRAWAVKMGHIEILAGIGERS